MRRAVSNLYIADIQDLYNRKAVVLTQHFLDNIGIRGISLSDVGLAITSGEIIEEYPRDYPHPSALILGYSENRPIHVVLGIGGGFLWLITAYRPDFEKWEADNKTRKAEK